MSVTISDVRCLPYSGSLTRPFITSRRRVERVTGVIVELDLAHGGTGRGSAAQTWAVTGESVESMTAAVHGPIRQALTHTGAAGLRAATEAIAGSCAGNLSAKAAVDVALHDAWAASMGLPLVEALGGAVTAPLRTDMTVSLDAPEVMAAAATDAFDMGFDVLKIKLGNDWEADLERLTAVHAAVPKASFRLDANQGWDAKTAIRVIARIDEAGIPLQLLEQPVAKDDLAGLAAVTAASRVPIMADESVASPRDAFRIAASGSADMLNIKLAKCGGVRQALAIADIAQAAGMECMIGAMMEPRISLTAAAHIAAAHPAITLVDLDAAEWIDDPALSGGYTIDGATMRLQHSPGLGFDTGTGVAKHDSTTADEEGKP